MFSVKVSYVPHWQHVLLLQTTAPHFRVSAQCTYILLLNAAFTVLVLLVSNVVSFLAPADTHNRNTPLVIPYVLTCVLRCRPRLVYSQRCWWRLIWRRVGCLNFQVLRSPIFKCDGVNASKILQFFYQSSRSHIPKELNINSSIKNSL